MGIVIDLLATEWLVRAKRPTFTVRTEMHNYLLISIRYTHVIQTLPDKIDLSPGNSHYGEEINIIIFQTLHTHCYKMYFAKYYRKKY